MAMYISFIFICRCFCTSSTWTAATCTQKDQDSVYLMQLFTSRLYLRLLSRNLLPNLMLRYATILLSLLFSCLSFDLLIFWCFLILSLGTGLCSTINSSLFPLPPFHLSQLFTSTLIYFVIIPHSHAFSSFVIKKLFYNTCLWAFGHGQELAYFQTSPDL